MTEKTAVRFILELETGFVDGWYAGDYSDDDEMERIRKTWDEARPWYTHIVCSTDTKKTGALYINDNRRPDEFPGSKDRREQSMRIPSEVEFSLIPSTELTKD